MQKMWYSLWIQRLFRLQQSWPNKSAVPQGPYLLCKVSNSASKPGHCQRYDFVQAPIFAVVFGIGMIRRACSLILSNSLLWFHLRCGQDPTAQRIDQLARRHDWTSSGMSFLSFQPWNTVDGSGVPETARFHHSKLAKRSSQVILKS